MTALAQSEMKAAQLCPHCHRVDTIKNLVRSAHAAPHHQLQPMILIGAKHAQVGIHQPRGTIEKQSPANSTHPEVPAASGSPWPNVQVDLCPTDQPDASANHIPLNHLSIPPAAASMVPASKRPSASCGAPCQESPRCRKVLSSRVALSRMGYCSCLSRWQS